MKNLFVLLVLACTINFVFSNTKPLIISGNIKNSPDSIFKLETVIKNNTAIVKINPKGDFKAGLNLPSGIYKLILKDQFTYIYLTEKSKIKLTLDYNNFDSSLSYAGDLQEINQFLSWKVLTGDKINPMRFIYSNFSNPEYYINLTDSAYNMRYSELNSRIKPNGKTNKIFLELYKKKLKLEQAQELYLFITYFFWEDWKPHTKEELFLNKIKEVTANIDINNIDNLKTDYFYYYLSSITTYNVAKCQDYKQTNAQMNFNAVDSIISNNLIKEACLNTTISKYINTDSNTSTFYDIFKKLFVSEYALNNLEKNYQIVKNLLPGNLSPNFNFPDQNDSLYSLNSFKGKFIYIDVWATWCGPCLDEIPKFQNLIDTFNGEKIIFVSICTQSAQPSWKNVCNTKKLKGIQLFAENYSDSFFEKMQITGYPSYILIDPEGKIINADAVRPSNPSTLKYLKNMIGDK